jgi:hypothetical protein
VSCVLPRSRKIISPVFLLILAYNVSRFTNTLLAQPWRFLYKNYTACVLYSVISIFHSWRHLGK